ELWVSEPENAKQWLDAQEQKTSQHLPTSRQGQLSGALLRYARPELQEYAFVESFTPEGLSRTGWGSWTEGLFPQLQDECWRLGDRLVAAGAKAEEVSKLAPDPSAADGDRRAGEARPPSCRAWWRTSEKDVELWDVLLPSISRPRQSPMEDSEMYPAATRS
ncbi:unnamed protein product, partial [Symbiodinium pilosum]